MSFPSLQTLPTVSGRTVPLYKQIELAMRDAISSGDLPYGSKLPNVQSLAQNYQTSVFTIQTALHELAKEGLIDRRRNRGTFVTAGSRKLTSVGLYFGRDFLHGREMAAYRVLHHKLTDALTQRGVKHSLWADTRSENAQTSPIPDFLSAVSQRHMQGVIVGIANRAEMKWLKQLELPMSVFGAESVQSQVEMDTPRMMRDALEELKRQGCRSVGIIAPWAVKDIFQTPVAEIVKDALQSFTDSTADLGLKTKDSWVRLPENHLLPQEFENFGYQAFQELWNQPHRPDGLLIYPDIVVRGSLIAMLQAGVSAPRDLKLVLHRNEGIPLLCPLQASWIESDLSALAAALIRQVEKQLAGQPVGPVLIPPTLKIS